MKKNYYDVKNRFQDQPWMIINFNNGIKGYSNEQHEALSVFENNDY